MSSMSMTTDNMYRYDYHSHYDLFLKKQAYVKHGLCGLVNLGNKCFLNSIIQCLSHSLKLTDYFLSNKFKKDDPEHLNKRKDEHFFLQSYISLLNNVWENNQVLKPKSLVDQISKLLPKYNTTQQQDSHEFLLYFLDLIHKSLACEIEVDIKGEVQNNIDKLTKKSLEAWKEFHQKEHSFIIDTFNGLFYNQVICNTCHEYDTSFEPYNSISLNINNHTSFEDCLNNSFQDKENVLSWKCDKCANFGCSKTTNLWTVPNHLIIHLKRFDDVGNKLTHHIQYPVHDFNITPYISKCKGDPNNYIYSLYAVNYHTGDTNNGHYWSCCKNLDDNWYMFNDGDVSRVHKTSDILTKDAYILFYYRKFIK